MKYIWARTEESKERDDDVFYCHVAVRLLRYFSFIRDGMSPDGPRSIHFLLKKKIITHCSLVSHYSRSGEKYTKYTGLEILKRHFSRRPVKGNSNFLWLLTRVFSLGINVLQDFASSTWSVSISGHVHLLPSFLPVKIFFWRHFPGIWVNRTVFAFELQCLYSPWTRWVWAVL